MHGANPRVWNTLPVYIALSGTHSDYTLLCVEHAPSIPCFVQAPLAPTGLRLTPGVSSLLPMRGRAVDQLLPTGWGCRPTVTNCYQLLPTVTNCYQLLPTGLGLSTNSDFAILDECFPYVARRLLSDDSPRMRAALRTFIYGGGDRLNVSKSCAVIAVFLPYFLPYVHHICRMFRRIGQHRVFCCAFTGGGLDEGVRIVHQRHGGGAEGGGVGPGYPDRPLQHQARRPGEQPPPRLLLRVES
eukprot:5174649-Pyramimonas_sp.AAC.1